MCIGAITQTATEMKLNKSQLNFDRDNATNTMAINAKKLKMLL